MSKETDRGGVDAIILPRRRRRRRRDRSRDAPGVSTALVLFARVRVSDRYPRARDDQTSRGVGGRSISIIIFSSISSRNRFCSVRANVKNSWTESRLVRFIRLERAMDEGAFLRAYALIAEDDDTGEASSSSSSSTVWVCARTRPLDDDAWVRLSSACGRFASSSSSSSSSSSRLACAGLDADSHDARCLIAEEASEELRENLRRMRDEEIEQSYARAEVVWAKRESGEEGRSARAALRVDLCHTYTPPERRGRGEGARVVEQLIAWARSAVKAESVVASCSFARRVLDEGG